MSFTPDPPADNDALHRLSVQDLDRDGEHTLALRGEIDMLTTPALQSRIERLCVEGATAIVLDLREVTFMDSAGLRMMLRAHTLCAKRGCELSLIPGPPHVHSLFHLTGLAEHLPFARDEPAGSPPQDAILPNQDAILPSLFKAADEESRSQDGH